MDDTLGIALAVAGGPILLTFANAWVVWRKEERDNTRQDALEREKARKAAETATKIITSNESIAAKVTVAAGNANIVADRAERAIQAIHILVNSTLTAALTAERDRTRESIELLRRVVASATDPDPKDLARLAELVSRESELASQLTDRAIQQSAVDAQQRQDRE